MATPVRGRFRAEDIFDAPDDGSRAVFRPALFPDLEIPIDDLWA